MYNRRYIRICASGRGGYLYDVYKIPSQMKFWRLERHEKNNLFFNLLFYYFGKLYAWIMNAQLKGSFLISLSKKNCLYSSGATLILIFGLKLRKTSQWAVQKGVTLKGEKFQWRIFCLAGGGDFRTITSPFSSLFKNKMSLGFRCRSPNLDLLSNASFPQRKSEIN